MRVAPARDRSVKRVLIIAYHFPPLAGSSGIQRTLRFVQHLPRFGWEPLVLTVKSWAYERSSTDLVEQVPPGVVVRRAWALDTARHLAVAGRHVAGWARPDRWRTWIPDGVRMGRQMVDRLAPSVLFSTYPIPTAHSIAYRLHTATRLPWIADFRDPMAQDGYPADPKTWHAFKRIEEAAVTHASHCTFTTPGALRMYCQRYPQRSNRMRLLENGFDEESFVTAEASVDARPLVDGALTLVHSGIVYPSERDPRPLFSALGDMKRAGELDAPRLIVRFRAPVHEGMLRALAQQHGVDGHVDVCPPVPYGEALAEMLRADGLLLMQASNCNDQVPAKAYEYLRARRPIVCLTDPQGDTAKVLVAAGVSRGAPLDSPARIRELLRAFARRQAGGWTATDASIGGASRLGRTEALARLLDEAAGEPRAATSSA